MRLDPNELEFIRDNGAPLYAADAYVRFFSDETVELTERGRAFYRAACMLHGLDPAEIEGPLNCDRLEEVTLKLTGVHLRAKYADGLPAFNKEKRIVDELKRLSAEELQHRLDQYEACATAGSSVVIVDFKRRRKMSSEASQADSPPPVVSAS